MGRWPEVVGECARCWGLRLGPPFPTPSVNYVAPGTRADGTGVVLKVSTPGPEHLAEAEALRRFAGRGAVRLLAADSDRGALLLERLRPGTPLGAVADDVRATGHAVAVMRRLWRPAPPEPSGLFPAFADWVLRMEEMAPRLAPAGGALARWIDRALGLYRELAAAPVEPVLLHGDLHQGNVLTAEREPWLAIDPKGVVGEPLCETGPLLLNALPAAGDVPATRRVLARRVEQLAGELGCDRARLAAWGVVRAVLASYWMVEDHGYEWPRATACAAALAEMAGGVVGP